MRSRFSFDMVSADSEAYITCLAGKVSMLKVSEDAQECGIATILTQLCLNEKKIHNVAGDFGNRALMRIKDFSNSHELTMSQKIENWVENKCEKILYLRMIAMSERGDKPALAAHVYFKAALEKQDLQRCL